jgi:hypothetical protein
MEHYHNLNEKIKRLIGTLYHCNFQKIETTDNNEVTMKLNIRQGTVHVEDTYLKKFKNIKKVSFPKSLRGLPMGAFYHQKELTKVYFEKDILLTKFPESCFQGCSNLINIDIPKSVVSIDKHAFKDTVSIKELDIPHTVSFIDPDAFIGWLETQIIYVYDEYIAKYINTKAEIVILKETKKEKVISPNLFIVVLKGGHVGRSYYMPMYIPVKANSKKEASDKVRWIPRVKKDHKDVVKGIYNVSVEEFYNQVKLNNEDPYFKATSKQEQNMFKDLIQGRILRENKEKI